MNEEQPLTKSRNTMDIAVEDAQKLAMDDSSASPIADDIDMPHHDEATRPIEETDARQSMGSKTVGRLTVREMTIIALLSAITIVLGLTGYGIINIPPLSVTTLHIPTLIAALVEGPKVGMLVGFVFGCYSLYANFTAPNILSPIFLNPLVSVVPRVIFPLLAFLIFKSIFFKDVKFRLLIAAFLGTCLHTALVMGTIFFLFGQTFAQLTHATMENVGMVILGLSVSHGLPEAIAAAVIVTPIAIALRKSLGKDK